MKGFLEFEVDRSDVVDWNVVVVFVHKDKKGEEVVPHKRTAVRLCDTDVTRWRHIGISAYLHESAIQPV